MPVAAAQDAANQANAEDGAFDLGTLLMDKIADHDYVAIGSWHFDFPHWEPIRLAGLTFDFSISSKVFFMALAGVLCLITFLIVGRTFARMQANESPSGFSNAVEAMIVFFRDQVVRANIGHGADQFTPFILTLFFFILYMNLLGLVPFGDSSTASISSKGSIGSPRTGDGSTRRRPLSEPTLRASYAPMRLNMWLQSFVMMIL